MDKEKLKQFLIELNKLEEKHGINVVCEALETIDYDWDESPFVSGVSSRLVFADNDGNEMTLDDLDIDDLTDLSR